MAEAISLDLEHLREGLPWLAEHRDWGGSEFFRDASGGSLYRRERLRKINAGVLKTPNSARRPS